MSFVSNSPKQEVPILNLKEQYASIAHDLEQTVLSVLRSGNYILGQYCTKLESEIASLCQTKYAIGVANGTDALILALWSLDIGPGDEVITPPFTFAATAEAISLRGAKPVFVDVDLNTFNIDVSKIEKAITNKTKAIMPVHLYGQPADMQPILALAKKYNLHIIEDNAQALGATYRGKPTGCFGDLACISFYPTKNLGACGDAGMIVTNSEELANRLRALRTHGGSRRYFHDELGVNSRLDELQAAVLATKLPLLKSWNDKRNEIAGWYNKILQNNASLITPHPTTDTAHVWHQYTVRIPNQNANSAPATTRDLVMEKLKERAIGSMCYYPLPLHIQPAFAYLGYKHGEFPVAEKLASEVLSLPMYPELTDEQVNYVASNLLEVLPATAYNTSVLNQVSMLK